MILPLILEVLQHIKDNGPEDVADGLCMVIVEVRYSPEFTKKFEAAGYGDVTATQITGQLQELWQEWPFFTGCKALPVPAPIGWMSPEATNEKPHYDIFHKTKNKWEGEYGAFRRDLLNFSIERVSDLISRLED